jgi:hypothetical protein
MAGNPDIRRALAELTPGEPVRLRLEDGQDITGIFRRADDAVYLERPNARVEVNRIAGILIDLRTQDPE